MILFGPGWLKIVPAPPISQCPEVRNRRVSSDIFGKSAVFFFFCHTTHPPPVIPRRTCVLFLSIGGATQTGGVFPDTYFFTFFFFYKFLCTIDTITINTTDRPPLDPAGSSNRPTARRGNNVDNNVTQIIRIRVKYTSGRCLIAGIRVLNI